MLKKIATDRTLQNHRQTGKKADAFKIQLCGFCFIIFSRAFLCIAAFIGFDLFLHGSIQLLLPSRAGSRVSNEGIS